MEYPADLLPRTGFRIIQSDTTPNSAVLLRRLNCRCGDIELDVFGELSARIFVGHDSLSKLNRLSLSLCGVFRPSHLPIRARPSESCPDPTDYWRPGDPIVKADDVAFDLLEECCPAYVRFSWWHERRFPVRDEIASLESAAFSGRIHVLHKPTMTNFWHFELEFRESEETILSNNSAKWKKKMYEFVCRDAVTGGGVVLDLDMPQCEPIPADLYT